MTEEASRMRLEARELLLHLGKKGMHAARA